MSSDEIVGVEVEWGGADGGVEPSGEAERAEQRDA